MDNFWDVHSVLKNLALMVLAWFYVIEIKMNRLIWTSAYFHFAAKRSFLVPKSQKLPIFTCLWDMTEWMQDNHLGLILNLRSSRLLLEGQIYILPMMPYEDCMLNIEKNSENWLILNHCHGTLIKYMWVKFGKFVKWFHLDVQNKSARICLSILKDLNKLKK